MALGVVALVVGVGKVFGELDRLTGAFFCLGTLGLKVP